MTNTEMVKAYRSPTISETARTACGSIGRLLCSWIDELEATNRLAKNENIYPNCVRPAEEKKAEEAKPVEAAAMTKPEEAKKPEAAENKPAEPVAPAIMTNCDPTNISDFPIPEMFQQQAAASIPIQQTASVETPKPEEIKPVEAAADVTVEIPADTKPAEAKPEEVKTEQAVTETVNPVRMAPAADDITAKLVDYFCKYGINDAVVQASPFLFQQLKKDKRWNKFIKLFNGVKIEFLTTCIGDDLIILSVNTGDGPREVFSLKRTGNKSASIEKRDYYKTLELQLKGGDLSIDD